MTLEQLQPHVKACLAANSAFAGVEIFVEFDPSLTPAELATQDARFEDALARGGLAVVVLSPYGRTRDLAKDAGASLLVTVPVAIVENPEVNRGAADPTATPPRTPLGRPILQLQQAAMSALLKGKYGFPAEGFDRPVLGADGLLHYYLLPARQVSILAA